MNKYIIYKITNNLNGKIYIGQSSQSLDGVKKRYEIETKYGNRKLYF